MVEDIDRVFLADGHGIFVAFERDVLTSSRGRTRRERLQPSCATKPQASGAKESAEPLVRCGSSLALWSVAGIWMEELAQRLRQLETQVGHQRAVIEHQQGQLMRQHTTFDADRATRVPVTVDLRIGNKLETIASESHEWKGRQKVAGFNNDEEKTVGLHGKSAQRSGDQL